MTPDPYFPYFPPNVEALIFYQHPWQPLKGEGLLDSWSGYANEQDDLEWLFRLQGSFDGHCYPPQSLGYDHADVSTWTENVLENFAEMTEATHEADGLFCYVSLWHSRPNGAVWYGAGGASRVIQEMKDIRDVPTLWSEFNVCMMGVVGAGGKDYVEYLIEGYDGTTQIRIVKDGANGPAGTKRFQFDPRFEEFKISGTFFLGGSNDGHYTWDFDTNGYPNNVPVGIKWFCDLELDGQQIINTTATGGQVIRRAKLWTEWKSWWGENETTDTSFLYELEQVIGD